MTTTKRKTLSEAAVDVLQASAKAGQEPMHRGPERGSDPGAVAAAGAVVDLGGATTTKPEGTNIGQVTAAHRSQAAAPKGPAVAGEPMHKGPEKDDTDGAANRGEPDAEPPLATQSGNADTAPGTGEAADTLYKEETVPTAEEIEAARVARLEGIRETMKSLSVEEDMAAMFAGFELSEDFKTKAKTIFEAAVITRAVMVVEKLEKEILEASEQAVEEIKEELESQVDSYLDHMVEQWMSKNEVAVTSGLKSEITEEFIEDLRNLFVEHNMNIPEEKVDVVEALTAKVEELQAQINETLNTNVELNKKINEAKKTELISAVCEGLTATQVEKFRTLTESVEFTTEGEYREKLNIIRGQYFSNNQVNKKPQSQIALAESLETPVETKEVSGAMARYVEGISRQVARS